MTPTELYRHYDAAGRLLYVGISISSAVRARQHMLQSGWAARTTRIEVERFPFRWLAEEAEKTAIMTERPLFNVIHNRIPREASGTARKAPSGASFGAPSAKAGEAVFSTRLVPPQPGRPMYLQRYRDPDDRRAYMRELMKKRRAEGKA